MGLPKSSPIQASTVAVPTFGWPANGASPLLTVPAASVNSRGLTDQKLGVCAVRDAGHAPCCARHEDADVGRVGQVLRRQHERGLTVVD
jgi:hypothetical protein